jgi:inorganic pyrophosphatase
VNTKARKPSDVVEVVIETPKGSRNKYAYDPAKRAFKLSKVLAEGMIFLTILALSRRPRAPMAIHWTCLY